MDLIYTVSRRQRTSLKNQQNVDWLHECVTLCTVSVENLIAFTTTTEVEDVSGKTWASRVYVADLNSPWECYSVLVNNAEITSLEWNLTGDKLCVTDVSGKVEVWTTKDHLFNEWVPMKSTVFAGEHIIASAFFHNGKKTSLVHEKKDAVSYSEKFTTMRFAPSLRQFGGRPAEGVLVVGTSGMVGVVVLGADGSTRRATESLGPVRNRIRVMDICYAKNGDFLVAVSCGKIDLPVQCYRVAVRTTDDKCTISSQALPSFFLQSSTKEDGMYSYVSCLKFVMREDADALVVAASGKTCSMVEMWELREKMQSVNKLFLQNQAGESFKTVVWQHHAHFATSSPAVRMATPHCALTTATPPPCSVMVALLDGTIHCLHRDSLQQNASTNVNSAHQNYEEPPQKLSRRGVTISSVQFTGTNSLLVVMDSQSQMYLYQLSPTVDPVHLLEYSLVTGNSPWDAILCLRGHALDLAVERFSENFRRQSSSLQQCYYVRFVATKILLMRMQVGGQQKAAYQNAHLMLYLIASAFKALLRPSDLPSHEKGPGERLSDILSAKTVEGLGDVDKVLLHLEAKEYTVEPSTLQSLQQLIQWVANFSLSLLASLPEHRQTKGPGYELLKDAKMLSMLRELMVIIRIWGLIRSQCLPTFVRSSENLDVLALLFKLVTRLLQSLEPDDSLLDECCLLYSQVMIPHMDFGSEPYGIASPVLWHQIHPIQMEYGVGPEFVLQRNETVALEGTIYRHQMTDAIRHIYLGKFKQPVKQCTRCFSMVLLNFLPRSAANKAWDQRWARSCHCRGFWKVGHAYS